MKVVGFLMQDHTTTDKKQDKVLNHTIGWLGDVKFGMINSIKIFKPIFYATHFFSEIIFKFFSESFLKTVDKKLMAF